MTTPVGALPTQLPVSLPGTSGKTAVQARYGHWQFASNDDNTNTFGFSGTFGGARVKTTLEVGYGTKTDCSDCNSILGGVELGIPLIEPRIGSAVTTGSLLGVALHPAVGVMKPIGSDANGYALSAAAHLPIYVSLPVGQRVRLAPFVSPGYGVGYINGDGESESGWRAMLGGGGALSGLGSGLEITVSAHRVFIADGATMYGIALRLWR
ncbi:MAG TPA: hypothetical protein VL383_06990 [Gemmatimonadaceae bacterium]|nr:hypothetical protein [Gemmatimonadaceae bacterium]